MKNQTIRDFALKFNRLNADNQRYIVAIQQALSYAQLLEKNKTEPLPKQGNEKE